VIVASLTFPLHFCSFCSHKDKSRTIISAHFFIMFLISNLFLLSYSTVTQQLTIIKSEIWFMKNRLKPIFMFLISNLILLSYSTVTQQLTIKSAIWFMKNGLKPIFSIKQNETEWQRPIEWKLWKQMMTEGWEQMKETCYWTPTDRFTTPAPRAQAGRLNWNHERCPKVWRIWWKRRQNPLKMVLEKFKWKRNCAFSHFYAVVISLTSM